MSYARTHLHALIREVQAGRHVHIRRRDGRSATLVPYRPAREATKPGVAAAREGVVEHAALHWFRSLG